MTSAALVGSSLDLAGVTVAAAWQKFEKLVGFVADCVSLVDCSEEQAVVSSERDEIA